MIVSTVQQIIDAGNCTDLEAVRARIVKIMKRREGSGAKGKWSYQDIVLGDGKNEVLATLVSHPPFDTKLMGKMVLFEGYQGQKGDILGLMVKDETFEDKEGEQRTVRKLKIMAKATCTIAEPATQEKPAQIQPSPAPTAQRPKASVDPKENGTVVLSRIANMMLWVDRAASKIESEIAKREGRPEDPEEKKSLRHSLYISCEKINLYYQFPPMAKEATGARASAPPPPPPPLPPEESSTPDTEEDDIPF